MQNGTLDQLLQKDVIPMSWSPLGSYFKESNAANKRIKKVLDVPFSTSIGTTLILNLFLTFFVGGISIGGHIGGAIAGALCATVMLAPGHKPMKAWATYAAPAAVGILSLVLSVLIVNAV